MTEWRGPVAIILALGVAGSIIILCLGAVLQDQTISTQGAAIIDTALGASVGAVAVYLGGRARAAVVPAHRTKPAVPAETDQPPTVSGDRG